MDGVELPQTISYMECNLDSIIAATCVVVMMVVLMIYLKIVATGEAAHAVNVFYPPAFFLGDTDKQRIQNVVSNFTNVSEPEPETETETESSNTDPWWTVGWRQVRRGLLHIESMSNDIVTSVPYLA